MANFDESRCDSLEWLTVSGKSTSRKNKKIAEQTSKFVGSLGPVESSNSLKLLLSKLSKSDDQQENGDALITGRTIQKESNKFIHNSLYFDFESCCLHSYNDSNVYFSSCILNGIDESFDFVLEKYCDNILNIYCLCPTYHRNKTMRDSQIVVTGNTYSDITQNEFTAVVFKEMAEELGIIPSDFNNLIEIGNGFPHPTKKHQDRKIYNYVVNVENCVAYDPNNVITETFDKLDKLKETSANKIQVFVIGTLQNIKNIANTITSRYHASDTEVILGFRAICLIDIKNLLKK